jgi:hypothetical protein
MALGSRAGLPLKRNRCRSRMTNSNSVQTPIDTENTTVAASCSNTSGLAIDD